MTDRVFTPFGRCVFPALEEPDEYEGNRFYKVSVEVTTEEAQPLMEQVYEMTRDAMREASKKGYKFRDTEDLPDGIRELAEELNESCKGKKKTDIRFPWGPGSQQNDDGEWEDDETIVRFNCKTKAEIKGKNGNIYQNRVGRVDGQKRPIPEDVRVGAGSILRASCVPVSYGTDLGCGVSLRLSAVQVKDLRSSGGSQGDEFDAIDDGEYVAPDSNGGDF